MNNTFPVYVFDENLQEVPKSSEEFQNYISSMRVRLEGLTGKECQKTLSLLGVACRIARRLDLAEIYLKEALDFCSNDDSVSVMNAKIRLAHVYQWQKKFEQSNALFAEIESTYLGKISDPSLVATYWQHRGKNEFDQQHYETALSYFRQAFHLREQGYGTADQLESTRGAILVTLERIKL